jgi:hypothetical protein
MADVSWSNIMDRPVDDERFDDDDSNNSDRCAETQRDLARANVAERGTKPDVWRGFVVEREKVATFSTAIVQYRRAVTSRTVGRRMIMLA